jgi:hypothetical protein
MLYKSQGASFRTRLGWKISQKTLKDISERHKLDIKEGKVTVPMACLIITVTLSSMSRKRRVHHMTVRLLPEPPDVLRSPPACATFSLVACGRRPRWPIRQVTVSSMQVCQLAAQHSLGRTFMYKLSSLPITPPIWLHALSLHSPSASAA